MKTRRQKWLEEIERNRSIVHEAPSFTKVSVPASVRDVPRAFSIPSDHINALDYYLTRATQEGFLPPYDEPGESMSIRDMLKAKLSAVPKTKQQTLLKTWFSGLKGRGVEREQKLLDLTKPNMQGFFPAYTPGDRHSQIITGFDTETDDFSNIIELAGLRLTYNFTKGRFEQLEHPESSEFVANYISPKNKLLRSSQAHGYSQANLKALQFSQFIKNAIFKPFTHKTLLTGFEVYKSRDRKQFLNWALKDNAMLLGHNILQADIPWLYQHKSGGIPQESIPFGFLDSFHLSEALVGRAQKTPAGDSDGRNKLQNLAKRFHVSAEDLGLEAHKGYNDVIVAFKVVEKLLKAYATSDAVREFLAAMEYGSAQTHRYDKNANSYGYYEGKGKLIEGVGGKRLMREEYEDLFEYDYIGPSDVSDVAKEATSQTTFDTPIGTDIDGNNTGYGYADEEPEEIDSSQWKSPREKLGAASGRAQSQEYLHAASSDTFGSGRVEALAEARRLFKSGASYSQVKDSLETLFRGSDVALEKGMLDSILGMAMQETGIAAKYAQWKKIKAQADRSRHEKVRLFQAGLERHRDNLYKVIAKRAQQVEDFKKAHHGMSPTDVLYKPGTYRGSHEEWMQTKKEAREALKYENMLHNNQRMVIAAEKRLAWSKKSEQAQAEGSRQTQQEKLDEWLKWGTAENPQSKAAWEKESKQAIKEEQLSYQANVSRGIQLNAEAREAQRNLQSAKSAYLENSRDWLGQGQYADLARSTEDMTESLKDYQKQVDKTVKSNKLVTSSLQAMYRAGASFYNPANYWNAQVQGFQDVSHATVGLLPPIFREAGGRFAMAGTQFLQAQLAVKSNAWNQISNIGHLAMAGGSALLAANPLLGGAVLGGGALINLGSNLIGGIQQANFTEASKLLASRINLMSASISMVLAPLKLLRAGLHGFAGLWSKFNSIMGIRYGIPWNQLTGVTSKEYSAMLDADIAFGLKSDSINNLHNSFALGQAGLYTAGQYDQNRLVAAARLGLFNTVYGSMSKDTKEQVAQSVDKLSARLNTQNAAGRKQTLYLASQIDKSLPEILERLRLFADTGIFRGSFADFQNGKAFNRVHQYNMGKYENAKWEWTTAEWSATRHQFDMGLKRIATPLWDAFGLPLMNIVNDTLNKLPSVIKNGAIDWESVKHIGKEFWGGVSKIIGIEGKSAEDIWASLKSNIMDFFGEQGLGGIILDGLLKAFNFVASKESELIKALEPAIQKIASYIQDIDFDVDYKLGEGIKFKLTTPTEKASLRATPAYQAAVRESGIKALGLVGDESTRQDQIELAYQAFEGNKAYLASYGIKLDNFAEEDKVKGAHVLATMLKQAELKSKKLGINLSAKGAEDTFKASYGKGLAYDTYIARAIFNSQDSVTSFVDAATKLPKLSQELVLQLKDSKGNNIPIDTAQSKFGAVTGISIQNGKLVLNTSQVFNTKQAD